MILPDYKLEEWAYKGGITPFDSDCVNPASVDLRVSTEAYVVLESYKHRRAFDDLLILIPGHPILATTVEFIRMPYDCAGVVFLKSSLARQGLDHALAGFVDPGFRGELTLELHAHRPVKLRHGQRVVQLVLYRLDGVPKESYHGKYQNQRGPTQARLT